MALPARGGTLCWGQLPAAVQLFVVMFRRQVQLHGPLQQMALAFPAPALLLSIAPAADRCSRSGPLQVPLFPVTL